jgi:hypothetical protein
VLSQKYKCIFVHLPKVAGQSIEHVFLDLHGLSWQQRAPLLLKPNADPAAGPPRLAHLKASEYVSCGHVSQQLFDSYFKFSFVRNPWDRIVSIYKYLGFTEVMPFKQFLQTDFKGGEQWEPQLFVQPQYDFLFDENGKQLVDYIGRFEELQSGFDHVCGELGISPTALPYVNKTGAETDYLHTLKKLVKRLSPFHGYFALKGDYTVYYDSESRRLVANLYAKEIEAFKYVFGK